MSVSQRPTSPVLVIEDNPDVRDVLALLLEQEGYAVVSAEHGRDALDQLRGGVHPCLILLDYHMPVMDGREFRRQQISAGIDTEIPVILYSADPTIRSDELQVKAVFRKPIDFEEVLQTVEQLCQDRAVA